MVLSSGFVALLNMVAMLLYYTTLISRYSRCVSTTFLNTVMNNVPDRVHELYVCSVVVSALSTFILVYIVHGQAMTDHYNWFKLRLYKQFRQLMARKTMWCMVLLSVTSAFMVSFTSCAVLVALGDRVMALFQVRIGPILMLYTRRSPYQGALQCGPFCMHYRYRVWAGHSCRVALWHQVLVCGCILPRYVCFCVYMLCCII